MKRDQSFRPHRTLLPLLGLAVLMLPLYLWWILLSPWGYAPPVGLPPYTEGPHAVFVYGTLRHDLLRCIVVGRQVASAPVRLPGYRKIGLDLRPAAGESVAGERFIVSTPELRRLDRYERLGIRYERIKLSLADGTRAWVYLRVKP